MASGGRPTCQGVPGTRPARAGLWVAADDSGVGWWASGTVVSPERGDISDEALCARVAAREEGAFDQLVERYQGRAYRLAWSLLRDPEDARDLSQEAFLRIYQSAGRFRGDARFSTWFYRILVNLCLDHRRRRRWWQRAVADDREDEVALVERQPAREPDPGQRASEEQTMTRLWAAVDRLSPQQRAAVVLSVQEQLTTAEIAAVLQCSEPTVRVHLHRAVQALRRTLVR
jgi:RNA polymerase sigma-70 factor (ECF subfamily)